MGPVKPEPPHCSYSLAQLPPLPPVVVLAGGLVDVVTVVAGSVVVVVVPVPDPGEPLGFCRVRRPGR